MHAPTDGLVPFFTADHRHCDELWAAVETAAEQGQEAAKAACDAFYAATRLHLDLEERVGMRPSQSRDPERDVVDASRRQELAMIVLHQDPVAQVHTVIAATSRTHGVLL